MPCCVGEVNMITKEQLVQEYHDWISQHEWNWIGTLTFRGYPSRKKAQTKFEQWVSELQKKEGGSKFRYIQVTETGSYKDNIHFHILIGGLRPSAPKFTGPWIERWEQLAGDAEIDDYDPDGNYVYYMLKDLKADHDFDINIRLNPASAEKLRRKRA